MTYDGAYNTSPAWSPDGNWIAYESRVGGQFDIWIIDPAGTSSSPLVTHPRSDEGPTWSPDGRWLAFSSTRRGNADIYAVGIDGKNLRRLTKGAGNNTSPAWGPHPAAR
ncbi:MAG: PD40 domain-containing protein [Deltaproteobacteria bacterium]|nr:PD40 domain-containing protein [Deltaproteobacteria bacterium]